jgi:hypothetical protein
MDFIVINLFLSRMKFAPFIRIRIHNIKKLTDSQKLIKSASLKNNPDAFYGLNFIIE